MLDRTLRRVGPDAPSCRCRSQQPLAVGIDLFGKSIDPVRRVTSLGEQLDSTNVIDGVCGLNILPERVTSFAEFDRRFGRSCDWFDQGEIWITGGFHLFFSLRKIAHFPWFDYFRE